jgi:hypothetical protein
MRFFAKLLLAGCLSLPLTAASVSACPLCKEAIPEASSGAEGDHDPDRLSRAYNYSIFSVLGIMFGLLGGVGFMIYRTHRPAE